MWASALFKFLVKVFKRLYLLNLWMQVVHTCPDVRYCSKVLCCTIPSYMSDLEIKVRLRKKIMLTFLVKFFLEAFVFKKQKLYFRSKVQFK